MLPILVLFASFLNLACAGWVTPMETSAKISPQEREELSKDAAIASRRAYAPRKARVAIFLAMEAQVQKACPACDDKDYSDPCPLGWSELSDGRCKAPAAYEGKCTEVQMFMGSSGAAKMELEMTCSICWPCTKGAKEATCDRDWSRPCPNGFAPKDIDFNHFSEARGTTCVADVLYEGECEPQVLFEGAAAKHEFAERCQTSWPCKRTCENYAYCPNGWQPIGDSLCMAPDWYKVEGCPLLQSFRGWPQAMKTEYAEKCALEWLCAEGGSMEAEGCQQLDLSSCPRHWIAKGAGQCAPPADAKGSCTEAKVGDMSAAEKIAFAVDCGIEWPCQGEAAAAAEELAAPREPAHLETETDGPIDALGRKVAV